VAHDFDLPYLSQHTQVTLRDAASTNDADSHVKRSRFVSGLAVANVAWRADGCATLALALALASMSPRINEMAPRSNKEATRSSKEATRMKRMASRIKKEAG
jgi:hypothetical protein